jgi:hypothetical protein
MTVLWIFFFGYRLPGLMPIDKNILAQIDFYK